MCRVFDLYRDPALSFLHSFRKCDNRWKVGKIIHRFFLHCMRKKYGLDMDRRAVIGAGLYINHPYNIAINGKCVLGKNVNITKGVTIGQENRGERKGAPTIGNCVWIGANATVVGRITVGDDVLIAPNSFVNEDVPSHSIVIGNPAVILPRLDATADYVNRRV